MILSELQVAERLLFVLLFGAVIGLERELTGQAAGLRTHISVARNLRPGRGAGAVVAALQEIPGLEVRSLSLRQEGGAPVIEADLRGTDVESLIAPLVAHQDVADLDIG